MVDRPWTPVATPGDGEYLALISFLPLKRRRTTFKFLRYSGAIGEQLTKTRGVLGFAFRAKILSRKFYTLSVWKDEAALTEFVGTNPHRGTMSAMRADMGETKFVRWLVRRSEI